DGVAILPIHDKQLVKALYGTGLAVDEFGVRRNLSRDNLEVGEFAKVGFEVRLEYKQHGGLFRIEWNLLSIYGNFRTSFARRWRHVINEAHHTAAAHVFLC